MEKGIKKKFIIIIAIIMVLVIAIITAISVGPMLFMTPAETGEFSNTSIYILKNNKNNVFLINSTDGYILIDAGSSIKTIQEELKTLNINESDIKHILITHTDQDHIDGLSLFKNAKIHMNEDILQKEGSKSILFERNSLPEWIKVENVNLLTDEELILGDVKIKCIKTPGHTPGHMVYLVDDEYLFTGDAVEISENTLKQHPFVMDEEKSKKSIKLIINIAKNCDYIFTGHYGYYKVEDLNLS